jgi:mRNA interferase RelE/StbE
VTEPLRLRVPDQVAETIRGLHPTLRQKIRAALQLPIERPTAGKALKNELAGLRSCRAGRTRILYRLAGERTLEIVAIGPRRTIYEETYRLLRRRQSHGHRHAALAVPSTMMALP